MAKTPEPVRLADDRPYPFDVEETRLHFHIGDGATSVVCDIAVERREAGSEPLHPRFDPQRGHRVRAALAAIGDGDRSNGMREVADKGLGATPKNH